MKSIAYPELGGLTTLEPRASVNVVLCPTSLTDLPDWEFNLSAMPRYFFHVYHDRAALDDEGEELADKYAAWREATVTAGQILQTLDGKLTDGVWKLRTSFRSGESRDLYPVP